MAIFKSGYFVEDLEIEEIEDNCFCFTFPSMVTRAKVLEQSLWNIKGHILVLKPCITGATVSDLKLDCAPIWVQIHGFPMGCITRSLASVAGAKIGEVLEVDFRTQHRVLIGQFVPVKVLFDTTLPLIPGFNFCRPQREDVWIQFRYERLLEFCFNCGRLGHGLR